MSNILEILETAPAEIASAAEKVVQAKKDLSLAEQRWGVARAVATVRHQEAKNQMILSALVTQEEEVKACEIAIIHAQAAYESEKLKHDKIYNEFLSARKIAGMDDRELHAISGSTIRGRKDDSTHQGA